THRRTQVAPADLLVAQSMATDDDRPTMSRIESEENAIRVRLQTARDSKFESSLSAFEKQFAQVSQRIEPLLSSDPGAATSQLERLNQEINQLRDAGAGVSEVLLARLNEFDIRIASLGETAAKQKALRDAVEDDQRNLSSLGRLASNPGESRQFAESLREYADQHQSSSPVRAEDFRAAADLLAQAWLAVDDWENALASWQGDLVPRDTEDANARL